MIRLELAHTRDLVIFRTNFKDALPKAGVKFCFEVFSFIEDARIDSGLFLLVYF